MAKALADIKIEWTGGEKMQRLFDELPRKLQERHMVIAIKTACAPLLHAMRAGAPVESGTLKKNIKLKVGGVKAKLIAYGIVGPASAKVATSARTGGKFKGKMRAVGKKRLNAMGGKEFYDVQFRNPKRYAHLVEGGRKAVTPKKKVLARGTHVFGTRAKAVAPRPFIKPAFEATKDQVFQRLADYFSKALAMEAQS